MKSGSLFVEKRKAESGKAETATSGIKPFVEHCRFLPVCLWPFDQSLSKWPKARSLRRVEIEFHNSHCELLGPSFQFSFHSLLIFVFRVVFVSAFPLSAFRLYKFSGRFPKPPSPHSTPRVERAHSERFRFPAFRFPLFLDLLRTPSFRGATIRPHREIRRLWHPESPSPASFGNDTVSPRRNCRRGLRCAASCGGHRFRTRTDFSIPCSSRAATPSGLWRFAN